MNFDPRIDPELQALLEEIAADPRARSFRGDVPVPKSLSCFDPGVLRESATGLTLAERELLRVHRDELAQLLLQASEYRLQQDPAMKARTSLYVSAERRRHFPDRPELIALLERAVRSMAAPTSPLTTTARTSLALLHSPASSAHQFAGLALRLLPNDASWIQIARALCSEGDERAASAMLGLVSRRTGSKRLQASALTWMGVMFGLSGQSTVATRCYSAATTRTEPSPGTLCSWFVEAIRAADREEALRASGALRAILGATSPAVDGWVEGLRARMQMGLLLPNSAGIEFARTLKDHVGPETHAILDAFIGPV